MTDSPELAAYLASIEKRFDLVAACIDGLSPDELNWRPPAADANSTWALAAHIAGNARAWICGIAAGSVIARDRAGEFAAAGDDPAALRRHIETIRAEVRGALEAIDPARLGVRLVPDAALWGEGAPREISVRDAILQVIEHASLHIGAMQLTRDLASAAS